MKRISGVLVFFYSLLAAGSAHAQAVCQCDDSQVTGSLTVGGNITALGVTYAQELVANAGVSIQQGDLYCARDAFAGGSVNAGTTLSAGAARASATPGTSQLLEEGFIYADTVLRGWAQIDQFGNLIKGVNVNSVSKTATGQYVIELARGVGIGHMLYGIVQLRAAGPPLTFAYLNPSIGPSNRITVLTYAGLNGGTAAGVPSDNHGGFFVVFLGG